MNWSQTPRQFNLTFCGFRDCTLDAAATHRGDDTVGLALPERDVTVRADDNVTGLAGGLGADNALDGHDGGLEGRLGAVGVQGHLALLKLQGHILADDLGRSRGLSAHNGALGGDAAGDLRAIDVRLAPRTGRWATSKKDRVGGVLTERVARGARTVCGQKRKMDWSENRVKKERKNQLRGVRSPVLRVRTCIVSIDLDTKESKSKRTSVCGQLLKHWLDARRPCRVCFRRPLFRVALRYIVQCRRGDYKGNTYIIRDNLIKEVPGGNMSCDAGPS